MDPNMLPVSMLEGGIEINPYATAPNDRGAINMLEALASRSQTMRMDEMGLPKPMEQKVDGVPTPAPVVAGGIGLSQPGLDPKLQMSLDAFAWQMANPGDPGKEGMILMPPCAEASAVVAGLQAGAMPIMGLPGVAGLAMVEVPGTMATLLEGEKQPRKKKDRATVEAFDVAITIALNNLDKKVGEKGFSWNAIAQAPELQPWNKTGKQINERYSNYLAPNIKKGAWSDVEVDTLFDLAQKHGHLWTEIGKRMGGRSPNDCKNTFHTKKKRRGIQDEPQQPKKTKLERAADKAAVAAGAIPDPPLIEDELQSCLTSIVHLAPQAFDLNAYRILLTECGHLSHRDWNTVERYGDRLGAICGIDAADYAAVFKRVLEGGNWQGAMDATVTRKGAKPWVVLVTGVNGARKTTTVYQSWFKWLLSQAISPGTPDMESLPDGKDSFFRQLDFMIATLANNEFKKLYESPMANDLNTFAAAKAAIYGRYRMLAEMAGMYLMKQCKQRGMNVMVETSGRDIASFQYIEHLFPDDSYNKLVLRFTINDIKYAEASVTTRMMKEITDGKMAVATNDLNAIVATNAGGPYGAAWLQGIQKEGDGIWDSVVAAGIGQGWYQAEIRVNGNTEGPWTACAQGVEQQFVFDDMPGA